MPSQQLTPEQPRQTKVWERIEIPLDAEGTYRSPCEDVTDWVDLSGPSFRRRVYGFWDGGRTYRVRVTATLPGQWPWTSGSNQDDPGLNGRSGGFAAELAQRGRPRGQPQRRGMIGHPPDGRGLQYADGTPFFLIGDTWWSLPTYNFPLPRDDGQHDSGPTRTCGDYLEFRKRQGFNSVALLAACRPGPPTGKRRDLYDAERHAAAQCLEGPGHQLPDEHAQRGRPALPVSRQGARL